MHAPSRLALVLLLTSTTWISCSPAGRLQVATGYEAGMADGGGLLVVLDTSRFAPGAPDLGVETLDPALREPSRLNARLCEEAVRVLRQGGRFDAVECVDFASLPSAVFADATLPVRALMPSGPAELAFRVPSPASGWVTPGGHRWVLLLQEARREMEADEGESEWTLEHDSLQPNGQWKQGGPVPNPSAREAGLVFRFSARVLLWDGETKQVALWGERAAVRRYESSEIERLHRQNSADFMLEETGTSAALGALLEQLLEAMPHQP